MGNFGNLGLANLPVWDLGFGIMIFNFLGSGILNFWFWDPGIGTPLTPLMIGNSTEPFMVKCMDDHIHQMLATS